jgi:uncharacterized protein (DUF433 family)
VEFLVSRACYETRNRLVGVHASRSQAASPKGLPVLIGTRMLVNGIVDNFDYGVSAAEIAEQFEVRLDEVEAILAYAQSHRAAHPV